MITLRPYQRDCVDAVHKDLAAGHTKVAAVLPTGGGKTVIFSAFVAEAVAQLGGKGLVLAHRTELIEQAAKKYRDVNPGARVGIIKAERNETDADVLVASVQTIRNAARLEQLRDVTVGVVDECHHATAQSYRTVMGALDVPWLGVTATLARTDGARLGDVWQTISYEEMTLLRMIRMGYLVDPRGIQIVVPDLDLAGVRKTGGDYREGELGERLLESVAPTTIAQAYLEHACVDGRPLPGIVFCPTVETAKVFAEAFAAAGLRTAAVWGDMPEDDRARVLRDYEEGRLDVLTNCMVLTEGFDSPRAQVAVIARPTQSAPLYVQMVGRVLRLFPGKTFALVIDVAGVSAKHELATLADLGGEKIERDPNGKVKSLLEEYGRPCLACDLFAEDCTPAEPCCEDCTHRGVDQDGEIGYAGPVVAKVTDLFAGSRQQWLQTLSGHWFLPVGDRYICLMPGEGGTWDVAYANAKVPGGGYIARGIGDIGYAMAQGESTITAEEERLSKKDGAWRRRRASVKQVRMAYGLAVADANGQRLGIDVMSLMSQGEVANLISIRMATRRLDPTINRMVNAG